MQRPKFIKPKGVENLYTLSTASAEPGAASSTDADSYTSLQYNRYHHLPIDTQRQKLPVFQYRNHILYLLERFQTLVLVGETGSGKSTQVPQYLADVGHVVCVTQPRAAAAATLAPRVATECGGTGVGWAAGAHCSRSQSDRIVFMTEGVLLREMLASPLLTQYSCIMLDEVHERTQLTDVLMGLLKKIAKKRKKLKLLVSSATMDAEQMKRFFDLNSAGGPTATVLSVQGRTHPVDIYYAQEPLADYVQASLETVIRLHENKPFGDVLVFLTSQEEITYTVDRLEQYATENKSRNKYDLLPLPMYGSLPHYRQIKVFQMADRDVRKVVVATNIAETSVTIPGVKYVIDCGYHKLVEYSPRVGASVVRARRESRANATQRAGRAGRTAPGECYRLYPETEFESMEETVAPEMTRSELSGVLLQLKALGIHNLLTFAFPTPPPPRHLLDGLQVLLALRALDQNGQLTQRGRHMAECPLAPPLAALLCCSGDFGVLEEALSIVSMLYVEGVFVEARGPEAIKARVRRRNKFEVVEGDLLTYLNVYTAYAGVAASGERGAHKRRREWCSHNYVNSSAMEKVVEIRSSLEKLVKHKFKLENKTIDGAELRSGKSERVARCIAGSLFAHAARLTLRQAAYVSVSHGVPLDISPVSCLHAAQHPQWLVYVNLDCSGERHLMRDVTAIKKEWLLELAPHYYTII